MDDDTPSAAVQQPIRLCVNALSSLRSWYSKSVKELCYREQGENSSVWRDDVGSAQWKRNCRRLHDGLTEELGIISKSWTIGCLPKEARPPTHGRRISKGAVKAARAIGSMFQRTSGVCNLSVVVLPLAAISLSRNFGVIRVCRCV